MATYEQHKRWAKNNPERNALLKRKHYLKKYGVTLEQYEALLVKQGGVCAICGSLPNGGRAYLDVDHCHITGEVRGLLCGKCNKGIGMFNTAPSLLTRAATYLIETGLYVE